MANRQGFPMCCGADTISGLGTDLKSTLNGFKKPIEIAITSASQHGAEKELRAAGFRPVARSKTTHYGERHYNTVWVRAEQYTASRRKKAK